MNGKRARQLRKAAGGQEIASEREYFGRDDNRWTFRLKESSGRRRYKALKKIYKEMKGTR